MNVASGATTARSAANPSAIAPFDASPTRRAGAVDIHSTTLASGMPRRRASVQTIGSPSCSDAMPPHASAKSPSPASFSAAGAGEWSETTKSMTPDVEPAPELVAVRRPRGSAGST